MSETDWKPGDVIAALLDGNEYSHPARCRRSRAMLQPPKPPKPDEPLGLGAVVRDAEGDRWVLYRDPLTGYLGVCWSNTRTSQSLRWAAIDAVEVLSEGVR